MYPSHETQLERIGACRSDLHHNGIDVDTLGRRALRALAHRDLEYFQAMLGYDAPVRQVVELIGATDPAQRRGRARATAPGVRRQSPVSTQVTPGQST